jgi:hypothetical protein
MTHKHDDRDIPTILLSARCEPAPPPTQTLAELEAIATDKTADPLLRRIAGARIQCNLFIGGAELVAERIRRHMIKQARVALCRGPWPGRAFKWTDLMI